MRYLQKNNWDLNVSQRIGLFVLILIILILELILSFQKNTEFIYTLNSDREYYLKLEKELVELIDENQFKKNNFSSNIKREKLDSLKNFDPNKLPLQGWEKLGFTPKQAEVIMKYKQMLGGKFESKEQIKKCFVVSEEIYALLSPYILLPEKSKKDFKSEKYQISKTIQYSKFNPNNFTEKDWVKIGFTRKQAEVILKYKQIVGGEFTSKEQLQKCFVISDEKFEQMNNYILLPEKEKKVDKEIVIAKEFYKEKKQIDTEPEILEIKEKFNPNDLDLNGWMKLGFTNKQAQTILNFKRSLGGKFKDTKALSRSYVISAEKFKELEPYLLF